MATSPLLNPVHLAVPSQRDVAVRVERALQGAIERATGPSCPPRLREALRYAVFPGGGRLRPQLALVVALASGDRDPHAADVAAAAVELVHCASLVHDDMPCFDDAELRRGKPSVHALHGEATALLVGDALIVHAFLELARVGTCAPLVTILGDATGSARGIIAGQAWEGEPACEIDEYHRAKTASLFEAAAAMGAIAAGASPEPWRAFGEAIGRAYQAADDLLDAAGDAAAMGKPTGRDEALGRPNVVAIAGVEGARRRAEAHLRAALDAIPRGPGEGLVRAWVQRFASRAGL